MNFPPLPDAHAMAVLALMVIALYLFTRERIPMESSSLSVLAVLAVGFELFPYEADGKTLHAVDFFTGFGHEALIAVCALMIAGQGIVRTGALAPVGRYLARLWKFSPVLSLLLTLIIGAVLSAFVNNTPVVVLLLPILISVSLRTGTPASDSLMPMGLATLVGGMATTIGTSTNLLVVSVAADLGLRRFQMFDFLVPVAIAAAVGIVYLWLVAPRLLPKREIQLQDTSPRIFTAQLVIKENSFADGKTLAELREKSGDAMKVVHIQRRPGTRIMPLADAAVKAGDRLLIKDTPENLKEFEQALGGTLYAGNVLVDEDHPLTADDQQLAEVVVVQGSPLEGLTINTARLIGRYQLVTLALQRPGRSIETMRTNLRDVTLRTGDVLLVQGPRDSIAELKQSGELLVLDATTDLPYTAKAPLALAIMAGIVLAAALGLLPIAISAVFGVLLMIISGCLDWRNATRALSVPVIMIVVTSLALGAALLKTGGAEYLAQMFVAVVAGASPTVILSGLILLMALLTNIVSNNAAAVIGTPIAISMANQLNLPAEAFVLAVLFGANMSYATPMAYKTNLLVMSAGGYTFGDFVRVGIPLTVIMWLVFSWVLPWLYGL
ncbi:MAG: SLC13 family permease [Gammaproteobacteria bacterium]|nr:SLC13 family permease [Gammaproteobacteria bacterium]